MGAVYEAERRSTHERFAIKVILEQLNDDPCYRARFEREVAALRSIRHPNVVNVYESRLPEPGSTESPFLVMELLCGEPLEMLLRREGTVAPARAVRIMLQVLDGLAAAHAVGVLHRDLGPTNVFLVPEPDGRLHVKVLDFGLARPLESDESGPGLTQVGTWLGKPAYVSPELLRNAALDQRADLFACGMVLYRMLAGRLPYVATRGSALWSERYAQRSAPPEYQPPRTLAPGIPEALDRIVARAIRKDPERRYASARAMQEDLLRFEDDGVDRPRPVDAAALRVPIDRCGSSAFGAPALFVGRRRSRPRARPSLVAASVVLAGLLAALLVLQQHETGGPAPVAPEAVAASGVGADGVPDGTTGSLPDTSVDPATATTTAPGAEPAAGAGFPSAAPADGTAEPTPETAVVRISLAPLPRGAVATVGGRPVPDSGVVEVERSATPLEVSVAFPDGRYRLFVERVVPSADRAVQVRLRPGRITVTGTAEPPAAAPAPPTAEGARADSGSRTVAGRFGTLFAGGYDEAP
ncbi:MAG: serine/threonine protein kinase [Deltaproteobacteria bacterium]|nr:serine/threonine protein kinase [Deltaproteobacteria bacterium]